MGNKGRTREMRVTIIIDTEEQATDILYDGYNIIADTLYDSTPKLLKAIERATADELGENLYEIIKR